jgi:benzoylformate decarboxylase
MARAIGTKIAIVDEAPATLGALRAFLSTESTRQYSFSRGGALGWGMPAAVGFSLGTDRAPVVSIVGMVQRCTHRRLCGRRRTKGFL